MRGESRANTGRPCSTGLEAGRSRGGPGWVVGELSLPPQIIQTDTNLITEEAERGSESRRDGERAVEAALGFLRDIRIGCPFTAPRAPEEDVGKATKSEGEEGGPGPP